MKYDQELAAKGKMRATKMEMVQISGSFIPVYRETTVKIPKVSKKIVAKPSVIRAQPVKGAPSKLDLARELYKANSNLARVSMIELFMEKLNMTKAGASTYYYNAQK